MFRHLVFAAVLAVAAGISVPVEAATRYRTDPAQSFLSFDEAVWRHGADGTWDTRWVERRIPLNLSFDVEVLDPPTERPVKRLALSNVSPDPSVPANSPFSLPHMLSWYPGSGSVEWSDHPIYNDGFTDSDFYCSCAFVGNLRYESGTFDGSRLDVQGGIGPRLSYDSAVLASTAGTDTPPPQLLAQTPVSSAFSYRFVAYAVPEAETVELLLVGLGLLAVARRRAHRRVGVTGTRKAPLRQARTGLDRG